VTLPQSVPGIAVGAVFVFVLSIGNFVTPALLGGGQFQMIGNLIYAQFLTANDWPFGAALSMVLIAIMMGLLFLQTLPATARRARTGRDDAVAPRPSPDAADPRGDLRLSLHPDLGALRAVVQRRRASHCLDGFSVKWYGALLRNGDILGAARNTLVVALVSTAVATVLGTLLAIGVEIRRRKGRVLETVIFAPMIIPTSCWPSRFSACSR
jgi:ABC-type spermidine/putrescine transport system permease subunit I